MYGRWQEEMRSISGGAGRSADAITCAPDGKGDARQRYTSLSGSQIGESGERPELSRNCMDAQGHPSQVADWASQVGSVPSEEKRQSAVRQHRLLYPFLIQELRSSRSVNGKPLPSAGILP